ncbi:MAG: hypothetical protein HKO68_04980 [Desulfobacterales bacterium]|nr:hypothetical protein [Desulfobacterales bacterium]
MTSLDDVSPDRLSLYVNASLVPLFFQLLGHGFYVSVQTGCSVKELLCDQLGINEDYLDQRIKTIFLNGKVVDNVQSAIVQADDTMALSGAMPGLVGAILRSGGFYAPMRSQISHDKNIPASQLKKGRITLKLWNLIVKELGPNFLQQGVWIKAEEAGSFMERHREELLKVCTSAEMDRKSIALDQLQDITWKSDPVFLQVNCDKNGS